MNTENNKRDEYRRKCKHYSPFSGQCYKKSIWGVYCHFNFACDGKCERMKRYDKLYGEKQC